LIALFCYKPTCFMDFLFVSGPTFSFIAIVIRVIKNWIFQLFFIYSKLSTFKYLLSILLIHVFTSNKYLMLAGFENFIFYQSVSVGINLQVSNVQKQNKFKSGISYNNLLLFLLLYLKLHY
jgi:hypothetical protein